MQSGWNMSEGDLPGIEPHVGFVDSAGRHVTLDEAAHAQGKVMWTIEEVGVSVVALAQAQAGMEAGSANDLKRASEHFREAHHLAPRWAQPVYQGAWTALLLGDAALAETLYAWTDRMIPDGYWTAKAALNCLQRERAGEFPRGTYLRYVLLESETNTEHRRDALEQIVKQSPEFAPAWKDLSVLRTTPESREHASERGLASRPDRETRAFLLLYKAQLLESQGMKHEAARLLKALTDPASGTLQTTSLAKLELVHFDAQDR